MYQASVMSSPSQVPFASSGVSQDVTTVDTVGSGSEFVSFAQPFAPHDVPAGSFPIITTTSNVPVAGATAIILSTHPDGSVRHALFAAQLAGNTTYKIRTGTQSGTNKTVADLLAAIPGDIARINASSGISSFATLRDLLTSATNRAAGGLEVRATPQFLEIVVAQNLSTHVRATFHVRWFGGTILFVDRIFENGYGNVAGQGDATYATDLLINGVTDFSSSATAHYNHAMWARSGWSSGGTLYVRHNYFYLINRARIFFNFDASNAPSSAFLNTLPQTPPPICSRGSFWLIPDDMNDTGYSDMIGPQTRADAICAISGGDKRAFMAMRNFHDCLAGFGVGYMSSTDGEHMRVSDYPNSDINNHAGFGTGAFTTSNPLGFVRTSSTVSHAPSPAFIAYMLTGDYRYLREMTAYASAAALWATGAAFGVPNNNRVKNGMTVRLCYSGEIRGIAWFYRNIGETAFALPDDHPSKAYFVNTLLAQFDHDIATYVTATPLSGIGAFQETYDWFDPSTGVYAPWEHAMAPAVMAHVCLDLGFSYGLSFAQWTGKFIAGLFNATREHPFEFAAGYVRKIGPSPGQFYSTWSQFTANTFNVPTVAQTLESGSQAMANFIFSNAASIPQALNYAGARYEIIGDQKGQTYYFANMIPGVAALRELGVQGGERCWELARLSGNWPDFSQIPQWGILPREPDLPSWRAAPGKIVAISTNHITDVGVDPETTNPPNTNYPGSSPWHGSLGITGIHNAWCGAAYARVGKYGMQVHWGGGHLGYYGNEPHGFNLDTLKWERLLDPFWPPVSVDQVEGELAPGQPCSNHSQYWNMWLPSSPLDNSGPSGLLFQAGSTSNHDVGGGGSGRSHAMTLDAPRAWSRYSTNRSVNNSTGAYSSATSVYDTLRERLWLIAGTATGPNTNLQYMDRGAKTWVNASPIVVMPYTDDYVAAMYVPKKDWIVIVHYYFNNSQPMVIYTIDLSNLAAGVVQRNYIGPHPGDGGAPYTWIPELGKFVSMVPTANSNTLIYLTPPSTITGTWVWSSENVVGPTPMPSVNQLFSKMNWASRAKTLILSVRSDDVVWSITPSALPA
jgi:hypothetical protein